jgi:hypothetical protein
LPTIFSDLPPALKLHCTVNLKEILKNSGI